MIPVVGVKIEDLIDDGAMPGIISILGELGDGAVIFRVGLERIFGKHKDTVNRAVRRGELPKPAYLFNSPFWTAGKLRESFEKQQDAAQTPKIDDADVGSALPDIEIRLPHRT